MFDPASMALVLGGALLATILQVGVRDAWICLRALAALLGRGFDQASAQPELARQIAQISRDGLIRAQPHVTGDAELDEATDAMIRDRSLDTLLTQHASFRSRRAATSAAAQKVLYQAAELSPLLGLAGTLLALGKLASISENGESIAAAIGMAVTTTFYGVIFAHFLLIPLAGLVERRARAEDTAREELYAWLEERVRIAEPARTDSHVELEPA